MPTKAQHSRTYRQIPALLRQMREEAELTQRELGELLKEPQSWVHNCETANRRVDISEFVLWTKACGVDPAKAFGNYLKKSGL